MSYHLKKSCCLTGKLQCLERARKCSRLVFSGVCVVGFLTQISMYIRLYTSHPTRIDIETVYESQVEIPAITICNNNRYRRSEVVKRVPELSKLQEIHEGIVPEYLMKHYFQIEDLIEVGHQVYPFINGTPNWEARPDVLGTYAGSFGNCYIINGNITGESNTSLAQRVGSQFNNVVVKIELENEEYLSVTREELKALVAIHNNFEPQPMEEKSYSVYSGEDLIILYSKLLSRSLPVPYKSACRDYIQIHRENGFTGPLSKKMCEYECFASFYRSRGVFPMYDKLMYYPFPWNMLHNLTFNDTIYDNETGDVVFINQVWSRCSERCPVDCEFTSYDFRTQRRDVTTIRSQIPPNYKNYTVEAAKKKGVIPCYLIVQPMDYNYRIFSLHPLIQGIEVFGYFGGTLGMWLGFSLLSAPDLVLMAAKHFSGTSRPVTRVRSTN